MSIFQSIPKNFSFDSEFAQVFEIKQFKVFFIIFLKNVNFSKHSYVLTNPWELSNSLSYLPTVLKSCNDLSFIANLSKKTLNKL